MRARAVTGPWDEILERKNELMEADQLQRDEINCQMITMFRVSWDDDIWTLVWMPKPKKARRPMTMKSLNKKAHKWDMDCSHSNGAYILTDAYGKFIDSAKTPMGLARKLAKKIRELEEERNERIRRMTMPLGKYIESLEKQYSAN